MQTGEVHAFEPKGIHMLLCGCVSSVIAGPASTTPAIHIG